MNEENCGQPTAEDLLYAVGVAASASGIGSFEARSLLASVTTDCRLTNVWLGYAALGLDGQWLFCRFAPATELRKGEGSGSYAALVEVGDLSGCYAGLRYRHTVTLLALSDAGLCIAFDSVAQGVAASDLICEERREVLESALKEGRVFAMRSALVGSRLLTPFAEGVLVAYPSCGVIGSVRVECTMERCVGMGCSLDAFGVFPRHGF